MSIFEDLPDIPDDAVFFINGLFKEEKRSQRVNLSIGVEMPAPGELPRIFDVVKKAEKEILQQETTKTYLPIEGDAEFLQLTRDMIFSSEFHSHIVGMQTPGATGALRLGGQFLSNEVTGVISISQPTWVNHMQIMKQAGLQVEQYPYWKEGRLVFAQFVDHLQSLEEHDIVLLHPCCHNPTGIDLTRGQWQELSKIFLQKKLIPFFDLAYQGFANSLEEDVDAINLFAKDGHELFVSYSYAKTMGLYGERAGALYVIVQDQKNKDALTRNLKALARTMYSNPPKHGSEIVKMILSNPQMREVWRKELEEKREHLLSLRKMFGERLEKEIHEKYHFIRTGKGFFSLLDLSQEQVERLRKEFAIYMLPSSRINLMGIFPENIEYIIQSLKSVL